MKGMDNDSLRAHVKQAMHDRRRAEGWKPTLDDLADAALSALRLNDLGAVEQRIAQALATDGDRYQYDPPPEGQGWCCDQCRTRATLDARTALAAALTRSATNEAQDGD